jgi:sulfur carrier protein ThiS
MIKLKDILNEAVFPMGYFIAAANANIKQKKRRSNLHKQAKDVVEIVKLMDDIADLYNELSDDDFEDIKRGYLPLAIEVLLDDLKKEGITFNYKTGTFNK